MEKLKSLRPKQAAALLGIGTATLWRWAKDRPDFPQPVRLSARCTVFPADELDAWRIAQGPTPAQERTTATAKGTTIRDQFAAQAMQAYCGDPEWRQDMNEEQTASAAYRMADAMLKARAR